MEHLLKVKDLKKRFGSRQAVDGISFQVEEGEILGLLGPNGAGKTTAIHMLSGVLKRDGGEILYKGRDIREGLLGFQRELGFVPQDISLYEELSAEENLLFFSSLYGLKKKEWREAVDWALDFCGLFERRKEKVKHFSGGMKRRLNIACSIAHRPKLVIMDEPTVGIDPQSRNHILKSISKLKEAGAGVLYTTHYMEEVEAIASRIVILDHGSVIASGTAESLKEQAKDGQEYEIAVEEGEREVDLDRFYRIPGVKRAAWNGGRLFIHALPGMDVLNPVLDGIREERLTIRNITRKETTLESVFLKLTGRALRDAGGPEAQALPIPEKAEGGRRL